MRSGGEFSEADRFECVRLIGSGGAVHINENKIRNARFVAVARTGNHIVAVGAIKDTESKRRRDYVEHVSTESGTKLALNTPEIGYIFVAREHRRQGLPERIVAQLLTQHQGAIFATTSHQRINELLGEFGFSAQGKEWTGDRGDQLSLWHRP